VNHGGDCGVEDSGVERLHGKNDGDQPWQELFAGDGVFGAVGIVGCSMGVD
jgi:hypothetical protein